MIPPGRWRIGVAGLAAFGMGILSLRAATYYVSPSGNDSNSGLSETAAFATPQVGVDAAVPGDTVLIMGGTYVHEHPWEIIRLRPKHRGSPGQWLTIKAYPGQRPVLKKTRAGAFWNAIDLSDGAAYVELNGLTVEGWNDELTLEEAQADYTQASPSYVFNANGIWADGRNRPVEGRPHHLRIINCTVRGFPAGGIGFGWADYITAEGNLIENCAWYSRYATSGTGVYQAWNSDTNTTDYKIRFVGNRIFNCRAYVDWIEIGAPSDGNGLIIDDCRSTQNNSPLEPYAGRILVANNLVVGNGGSGIHAYLSDNVDIVHNTSYHNSQVLDYGEIFANQSGNIRIINNVCVARPDRPINKRNDQSTNAVYKGNLYYGGYADAAYYLDGNTVGSPGFANPSLDSATSDFRVTAGSPALDAALVSEGSQPYSWVSQLGTDLAGGARVRGVAPDIGAYEREGRPLPAAGLAVTGLNEPVLAGDADTSAINGTSFGLVEVGQPTESAPVRSFKLINRDATPLTISGVTLAGDAAFTLVAPPAFPLVLAPAASVTLSVRFLPTAPGPVGATVRIAHSSGATASPFVFALSGTGDARPALGLSAASVGLRLASGSTSSNASVVVANLGSAPLTWNADLPGRYTVNDSTAPSGPVYNWIDISGNGTAVSFAGNDDAFSPAINLGFTFPFFGTGRSQIVVNANGFISFDTSKANKGGGYYTSGGLATVSQDQQSPAPLLPRSILALWEDLYLVPNVSKVVTRKVDADTFVISWLDATYYGDQSKRLNFQLILRRDGTILAQYRSITVPVRAYVLGIINAVPATLSANATNSPDQFVEYANTRNLISAGLAVRYLPPSRAQSSTLNFTPGNPSEWARLTGATSGVIAPGASQAVPITFNPANLVAGLTYRTTLTLVTNDAQHGSLAVPVSLTVGANGTTTNLSPRVALTQPARDFAQSGLGLPIALTANATDDGSIGNVEFFADGVSVGSDSTPPYTGSWTPTTPGVHTLTARAADNLGATADALPVEVTAINLPPAVAMAAPVSGSTVPFGQPYLLTANASDTDGGSITKVEFYVNDGLIGTATSAPFTYLYTAGLYGDISVFAKAFDNNGGFATSDPARVTVVRPNVPGSGLLAHWRFEETSGTLAADSSGQGRAATLADAVSTSWTPAGKFGGALACNGTAAARASFDHPALTAYSLSAWVNGAATGQQFPRIFNLQGGASLFLVRNNGADANFTGGLGYNDGTGGDWRSTGTGNSLAAGAWQHVVVTFDASRNDTAPVFYINGVRMGTAAGPSMARNGNVPVINATTSTQRSVLGNRLDSARPFNGVIDQVRLYNRVLTDAEVVALFQDNGGPGAPGNVRATPVPQGIRLTWDALTAPNTPFTYEVSRAAASGGPFTPQASGLTVTDWTDSPVDPGVTYFYTVRAAATGEISVPSLTVSATAWTPKQNWRYASFGTTAPTGSAADSADPDGDGASNLLEYAVGRSPTLAEDGLPARMGLDSSRHLTLTFHRATADVTYVVEATSDLAGGPWSPITFALGPVGSDVTAIDPQPLSSRRFLRLRVSAPPEP